MGDRAISPFGIQGYQAEKSEKCGQSFEKNWLVIADCSIASRSTRSTERLRSWKLLPASQRFACAVVDQVSAAARGMLMYDFEWTRGSRGTGLSLLLQTDAVSGWSCSAYRCPRS